MTSGVVVRQHVTGRTPVWNRYNQYPDSQTPTPPDPPPSGVPTFASGPTVTAYTQTSATITWTSNEFVQAWMEYGTTIGYGNESGHENSFNYQTHIQTISNLTQNTLYHYRVKITDQDANVVYSGDNTFTTQAQDPVIPPPDPGSPDYGPRSAPSTPVGSFVKTLPNGGGVDFSGVTECAAAVQAWFNANVPNGTAAQPTVFVVPSGAILKMGTALKIENGKHHITLWLYGSTWNKVGNLDSNDQSSMIWLVSVTNIKILGGTLNGGFANGGVPNVTWGAHEHAHGISAWNQTADFEIADITINKTYGDAVYSSNWSGSQHNRWYVHHITGFGNGRNAITKNGGGDDWVIENCILRMPSFSNVGMEDFAGPPQTCNRLTIRNNWMDGWSTHSESGFGYTPAFGLFMQSSEIVQPMDTFVFDNNLFSRGYQGYGGVSGACPGGQGIIDCANRWAGSDHCGGTPAKTNWFFRGNVFDSTLPIGNGGLCTGQSTNNRLALAIANCNTVNISNNNFRGMPYSTAAYTTPSNQYCGSFNNPACTNVTQGGNT